MFKGGFRGREWSLCGFSQLSSACICFYTCDGPIALRPQSHSPSRGLFPALTP